MDDLTSQFIDRLLTVSERYQLPAHRHLVKRCLLDYLGVTFAGSRILDEKGKLLLAALADEGTAAQVIGYGVRAPLQTAVLVNGLSSHVAELDDGVRFGSVHPGAPIFSALLPVAESHGLSATQFFKGVIAGYEAAGRLAMAIQPSHRGLGYHASGTCGTIGAAMAIAVALDYSRDAMRVTLAAAVTSASGMLKMLEGGSNLKAYNVANAASSGLVAAMMARSGFEGPDELLDGPRGFLSMSSDKIDISHLQQIQAEDKSVLELTYVKPYAACRHCHPAIEAALTLRKKHGLLPEAIKAISVHTYRLAGPGHDHSIIDGITSAKMSTPYSIAVALIDGQAGITQFESGRVSDPAVQQLAQKVSVHVSEELDRLVPDKRAAIVEIKSIDGQVCSLRVDLPKGEPESPLSDAELVDKFTDLARYRGLEDARVSSLTKLVWELDTGLPELFRLL
ncbi:MmgE/PrpD family protein [Akkermansiaceae bacterium]|nr:MmgE/PrpD family protein [Akkermansiaceae bacterium]